MTEGQYKRVRHAFLRQGEFDPELLILLRRTARRLIRFRSFPPLYSPTGSWDQDAEDEVLNDWITHRLLGSGQLAALLQQAATPGSFMRLGELYLRRHLINRVKRSQAINLHSRVRELLDEDDDFHQTEDVWSLQRSAGIRFRGSEKELLSAAWGLGHFEVIRYREDARKLSPLLERDELRRFISGLLEQGALSVEQLMRALVVRFDLEPVGVAPLHEEEAGLKSTADTAGEVMASDGARVVVSALSPRQVEILRNQLEDLSVREIASRVAASVGTVSAEQKVIAEVLARASDSDTKSRARLLNALRDLLFIDREEP